MRDLPEVHEQANNDEAVRYMSARGTITDHGRKSADQGADENGVSGFTLERRIQTIIQNHGERREARGNRCGR